MTFVTILSYALPILGVSGGFLKWIFSIKKTNRKELEKKDGTIGQLRKAIVEMVELDGDKKDVEIQRKKIKKNIDTMSDDGLSIAYANQLPNIPKKRKQSRGTKKP